MTEHNWRADATEPTQRLSLIACGASARELHAIINKLLPDVNELNYLLTAWHNHLKKIVTGRKAKVKAACKARRTSFVICSDELRSFFSTDFMLHHFERIVMKGMGLHDHPQLRDIYFAHYKRVLYIAQTDEAALVEKGWQLASTVQLEDGYHYAGSNDYTAFLQSACCRRQLSIDFS